MAHRPRRHSTPIQNREFDSLAESGGGGGALFVGLRRGVPPFSLCLLIMFVVRAAGRDHL